MRNNMMNYNRRTACDTCTAQKKALRAIDFAINDTVLYLDAYPDCRQALDYYHRLIAQRKAILEKYQGQCPPMTFYGNESRDSWDWTMTPWPWEPDANEDI